jgi:AcrR family transcriptional regulator
MRNATRADAIPTQVKDPNLVERRRRQIADAAARLFVEKGFHKTTTRQIARAADISIGSLYEYFTTKEDILYIVCDFIHTEMEQGVASAMADASGGRDALAKVIREYFMVCHRMSDFILMIYQETQSLPRQWQRRVLENELRITGLLVGVLARLSQSGELPHLDERSIELTAHNIVVMGHMWTFRRWFLGKHYGIEDYIALQTAAILRMCTGEKHSSER